MNNYKKILNEFSEGYGYIQVLYDGDKPSDLKFIDYNSSFLKITGFPENTKGKTLKNIFPGIENDSFNWFDVFGRFALTGGREILEFHSDVFARDFIARILSDGDGYLDVIFTDKVDSPVYREKLTRAEALAEEITVLKENFLANMSHELRTPLNGIIGMANLLKDSGLDSGQEEFLNMLMESADILLTQITDILDFSRIERHELEIHKIDFDLSELVRITTLNLKRLAETKGLEFKCYENYSAGEIVNGDKIRIGQILVNLLTNAIKFTSSGSIDVKIENTPGKLIMVVKDTGIGISEKDLGPVFASFRQLENTYTKVHKGVGLGLSIVKSLVDLMEGEITVESRLGEGSTFTVSIPSTARASVKVENEEAAAVSLPVKRVLIVEDEAINRMYMVKLLQKEGWDILEAENGVEAVRIYSQEKPDLIIMDVGLPGLDGISATRIIRESEEKDPENHRAKIVALTAHAFEEDIENCLKAGMDDYLSKPVKSNMLLELIFRMLSV